MAKKLIPINKIPVNNKLRVSTCKECNGNPPKKIYDTGRHTGECCEICYHVLNFKLKPKENE